jgi:alpha-L-fucosidase
MLKSLLRGIATTAASAAIMAVASTAYAATAPPADEPLPQTTPGPFEPSWDSLSKYQCPDWFRDAKFGIWAHWSGLVITGPVQAPCAGPCVIKINPKL